MNDLRADEARPHIDALAAAETLLVSSHENLAQLWIREFADDVEAHDDELQAKLERDFIAAFDAAMADIAAKFGAPRRVCVDFDADGEGPIGGAFRLAVWQIRDSEMWLAAAHEDRELPFMLLLGCVYREADGDCDRIAWLRR